MERVKSRLSALLPHGWYFKESITLLASDGRANVIASSEPLDPTIDVEQYAEKQGEVLEKEFPGYRQLAYESMDVFGGHKGKLRSFEWHPPPDRPEEETVPVTQLQLYYVESGRGYTATATIPSIEFEGYQLQLIDILEGLLIEA
jgi:hypothetical protein